MTSYNLDQATTEVDELVEINSHLKVGQKNYSDVVDGMHNQYVDIVMQGGGVLGLALVGYTYVLEKMGLRFRGIGGTSAGAINTIALAAASDPHDLKSLKILEKLEEKNFSDFVDGGNTAEEVIEALFDHGPKGILSEPYYAYRAMKRLNKYYGLNPGNDFQKWMTQLLADFDILSNGDLNKRLSPKILLNLRKKYSPEETLRDQKNLFKYCVITSDISTETMVSLPDMAGLYYEQPDKVNPAEFARMSMAVPAFFYTHKKKALPLTEARKALWEELTKMTYDEQSDLPEYHHFVDGGMTSNFPINIFHARKTVPQAPTFGVKLSHDQRKHDLDGAFDYISALIDTARHTLDYTYIRQNEDYDKIVKVIDIPKSAHWLDFNLKDEIKAELFIAGAEAAIEFLENFQWEGENGYQQFRAALLEKDRSMPMQA